MCSVGPLCYRGAGFILSGPGFFWMSEPGGRGAESAAAYSSKTTHGIEMKFGKVVENHKLLSLV